MGRKPTPDQTPDLFSPQGGASPNEAAETSRRLARQPALPKDLPRAIQHLPDIELDWLVRVAIEEAKRRGRPVPADAVGPTKTDTAATPRERQNSSRENRSGSGIDPGPDERGPSRVQGRCAATPNWAAVRLVPSASAQGPLDTGTMMSEHKGKAAPRRLFHKKQRFSYSPALRIASLTSPAALCALPFALSILPIRRADGARPHVGGSQKGWISLTCPSDYLATVSAHQICDRVL
jgi:hypothetical protein